MIKNVVDYLNYRENVRSHQVQEAETERSHRADEYERNRHNEEVERENYQHNRTTEALGWSNLAEDIRTHKANEALKSRELDIKATDVASQIDLRQAQKSSQYAQAEYYSARAGSETASQTLREAQAKTEAEKLRTEKSKQKQLNAQAQYQAKQAQYAGWTAITNGVSALGSAYSNIVGTNMKSASIVAGLIGG